MRPIPTTEPIISNPNVRSGQPTIAGTTVRVLDLVARHLSRGLSAKELAAHFRLDLGQVHAALAYYYQHKAEFDAQIHADAQKAEALKEQTNK